MRASACVISRATSLMSTIWSRKSGSIAVASLICSTLAPPRSACWIWMMRSWVGRLIASRSAGTSTSPSQWKTAPFLSIERIAFCSASVKFRPSAIASPTDFIVVVSVSSAAGNFSNAKRGTLTTT